MWLKIQKMNFKKNWKISMEKNINPINLNFHIVEVISVVLNKISLKGFTFWRV